MCAWPSPNLSDLEAWGTLDAGADATSEIKVGLFGYDISCIANWCALQINDDSNGYCPTIAARGLDGLSFGANFKIDITTTDYYCAGFHHAESADNAVCVRFNDLEAGNFVWGQYYTVTSAYFEDTEDKEERDTDWGYYGLGYRHFYSPWYSQLTGAEFETSGHWRFIGENENDGQRYTVGDTIDMFALDFANEKFTENEGFELAHAATLSLAAGGIALISAALM